MKLREREGEALGDLDGALDRMLLAAKQLQHLLDRLEMTLAIDLEPEARFRDGAFSRMQVRTSCSMRRSGW